MAQTQVSKKCIRCGIDIKPGHAIYIAKVNIVPTVKWGRNRQTMRYEKLDEVNFMRIQHIGNAKPKSLICLACFDKVEKILTEE